jgi:NB-ARC domain
VLNDVWDQEVLEASENAGLKLLVTTRDESVAARLASGAHVLTVGGLSGEQARELLGRAARMRKLPRAADGIIRAAGGSPLALAAVGAALQHTTQWEGQLPAAAHSHSSSSTNGYASSGSASAHRRSVSSFPLPTPEEPDESDDDATATTAAGVSNGGSSTVAAAAAVVPLSPTAQALSTAGQLRCALDLARSALPVAYREMYDVVAVLPAGVPVTCIATPDAFSLLLLLLLLAYPLHRVQI